MLLEEQNGGRMAPDLSGFSNSSSSETDFYLLSERHPKDRHKRIRINAKTIDDELMADGVNKKLIEHFLAFPDIQYIGLSGSTLTLLGVVRFDKQDQELILEKTAAFISGGFNEAKAFISDAIKHYR